MDLVNRILEFYVKEGEVVNEHELRPLTIKNAADTFEALIGASFIDRGYEKTRAWIRNIYAKYDLVQQYLNEDNFLDILQMYTKSSLPRFNYSVENQVVTISTVFQNKPYQAKNKLKQKAKQDVVKKIVHDLMNQKLIPANILSVRGCGQKK
jgi:dsRNA-specific ribonuclease